MFKTDGAKEYSAKSFLRSVFALILSLNPCVVNSGLKPNVFTSEFSFVLLQYDIFRRSNKNSSRQELV